MRRVRSGKVGRPRVEIDWPTVARYVETGNNLHQIAHYLGINRATLCRRIAEEREGQAAVRQARFTFVDRCRRGIVAQAIRGNSMAIKLVGANVLHWRSRDVIGLEHAGGGPVQAEVTVKTLADLATLALGYEPETEAKPADVAEDDELTGLDF
jgi:hypothetical protein